MRFRGRGPFEKWSLSRTPTSENFWKFRLSLDAEQHFDVEQALSIFMLRCAPHGHEGWCQALLNDRRKPFFMQKRVPGEAILSEKFYNSLRRFVAGHVALPRKTGIL
jgi:hypothetical protein